MKLPRLPEVLEDLIVDYACPPKGHLEVVKSINDIASLLQTGLKICKILVTTQGQKLYLYKSVYKEKVSATDTYYFRYAPSSVPMQFYYNPVIGTIVLYEFMDDLLNDGAVGWGDIDL